MKIDLKLVFLALFILCIVSETSGWGSRRRSGSRTPSSSRRRSGGWGGGSRRRTSSPSRRRSWTRRPKPRPRPRPRPSGRWWRGGRKTPKPRPRPKPKPKPRPGWWRRGRPKPKPKPRPKPGWWRRGRPKPKPKPKSKAGWWSSSKSKVKFPHDIKTKSGLNKLLGSEVKSVKHVERPLSGFKSKFKTPFGKNRQGKHTGVVVTLNNGKQYLIHKGDNYGKPSGGQTVVTDTKHMSSKWTTTPGKGTKQVKGKQITDFVKEGGKTYKIWSKNCQHASDRMYNLGDENLGKRNMCKG